MNRMTTRRLKHQRYTLALLFLALVAFGILVALAPLTKINFWAIDLYTFRAAAKAMQAGADPYAEPNIIHYADGAVVGNIHNYIYAPYFAFALRPLAWLSPAVASKLWFVLNLGLYFGSIGLLAKAIRWQPGQANFFLFLAGLVLFPPLRTTLTIGQSTVLSLFCFALALFLLKQNSPLAAGLIFSISLFKPNLAPLLLFFILVRQWRFLGGAGLGLTFLSLPFWNWLDNWLAAAASTHAANLGYEECFQMVSLTSLVKCTIAPTMSTSLILLIGVVIAALLMVINLPKPPHRLNLSPQSAHFDRLLALFVTLSALLVDHTRIADQLIFIFPLLVIWRDWPGKSTRWPARISAGLIAAIYILPYTVDFLQAQAIVYQLPFWYIGISLAVLTTLLLHSMLTLKTDTGPYVA